jgi:hypothetical protein
VTKRLRRDWAFCTGGFALLVAEPAAAQEQYTPCLPGTRTIHEFSPRLSLNHFRTGDQTVAGIGYGFSQCLGETATRLRIEASFDHVDERSFRADAAVVAVGLELHPLKAAPSFALVPFLRLGREFLPHGRTDTVAGGSLLLTDTVRLAGEERRIGDARTPIDASDLLLEGRLDYIDRRTSDPSVPRTSTGGRFAAYGGIGFDSALPRGNWRWTARAGYQTVPGGSIAGFARLSVSARKMDGAYANYPWNVEFAVNSGDHGYRAVSLALSFRFARAHRAESGTAR